MAEIQLARLAAVLALGMAAAAGAEHPARANVLFIVVDALRPDHLGSYGYGRPTSPAIDTVAREGLVFRQAFSTGSYTSEVVSTLFSGLLPSLNPAGTGWYAAPDPARPTLAEHFKESGWSTGAFSDHPVLRTPGFERGFEVFRHFPWLESWVGRGPEVADAAAAFLRDVPRGGSFFVYVHLVDPHGPYTPPDEFRDRIDAPRHPEPLNVYTDVRPRCQELIAEGFGPGEARFEDMVARYDAEIAYSDHCVAKLTGVLDELGYTGNTTVVITSDHGEEFLEHGFVEHGWTLYNEVLRVPLIVRSPGRIEPGGSSLRVSLVDLFPSILEVAGVAHERADLSGVSLFHAMDGVLHPRNAAYPIISEIMIPTRNMLRTVIAGDYKLLQWRQYHSPARCAELAPLQQEMRDRMKRGEFPSPDPWGPVVHEELYDIARDPGETRNILEEQPRRRVELTGLLRAYERLVRGAEPADRAAPAAASPLPEYDPEVEEQMRALGYLR